MQGPPVADVLRYGDVPTAQPFTPTHQFYLVTILHYYRCLGRNDQLVVLLLLSLFDLLGAVLRIHSIRCFSSILRLEVLEGFRALERAKFGACIFTSVTCVTRRLNVRGLPYMLIGLFYFSVYRI